MIALYSIFLIPGNHFLMKPQPTKLSFQIFLSNAAHLLLPKGQIHVTLKTTPPYNQWNILGLVENIPTLEYKLSKAFDPDIYIQYTNKQTAKNSSFNIKGSKIFVFGFPKSKKEKPKRQITKCDFCAAPFHCNLCHITCKSEDLYNVHLKGKRHLKKKIYYGLEPAVHCDICNVDCRTLHDMKMHLKGFKHLERKNLLGLEFKCEVCDILCNSADSLRQHLESGLHKKKKRKRDSGSTKILPPTKKAKRKRKTANAQEQPIS